MNNEHKLKSSLILWCFGLIDLVFPLLILFLLNVFFLDFNWRESYEWLGIISGASLLVGTYLLNGYSRYKERTFAKKIETVFKSWFLNVLLLIFVAYLNLSILNFSRSAILLWAFSTPVVILFAKVSFSYLFDLFNFSSLKVVFIGECYKFTNRDLKNLSSKKIESVYIVPNQFEQYLNDGDVDYFVINLDAIDSVGFLKDISKYNCTKTRLISLNSFMESFLRKCYVPYESISLDYLNVINPYSKFEYFLKRVFDLSFCFVAFSLLIPFLFLIIYKIKKESPGSILFKQKRIGLKCKGFTVYKFRTMHENSFFNPYTDVKDTRIFPFGEFMRRTRVDELPQLYNILKGDMHLFGPRTEWDILVENYEQKIPYYHERHLICPGVSGWAQVLYPYGSNAEDARQKLMYDLYYIKHWSIWLDIETAFRTCAIVLGKKGM
ncbi:sugar transferase [Marinomonas sp. PE14-40]|uniref:sugar transferase n=1 Tax=Marinomonas sp. PE14-40 TaxID=3060621 RepID=UPI003F671C4B